MRIAVELVFVTARQKLRVISHHPQRLLQIVRRDIRELFQFGIGSRQLFDVILQRLFGTLARINFPL